MDRKKAIFLCVILLLIYTRFVGLNWGLPYPMHPDERNIANAIMQLQCPVEGLDMFQDLRDCMNPNFYAYGQAPLYVSYVLVQWWHVATGRLGAPVTFEEATMSLRLQSAFLSIVLVVMLWKVYVLVHESLRGRKPEFWYSVAVWLVLIFQPYAIQFAHFGTTEAALMLAYVGIVYTCLRMARRASWRWVAIAGMLLGIAVGLKSSSIIFTILPTLIILWTAPKIQTSARYLFLLITLVGVFTILASPHNLLNSTHFLQSMEYEISVAQGSLKVFYTRQFEDTIPYLFQFTHIFPYALGVPILVLSVLGFFGLSWKNRELNIVRISWLLFFVPTAAVYAKWTRFMAPIMPVMTLFALSYFALLWDKIEHKFRGYAGILVNTVKLMIVIIPGVAYLSIYQYPDVRLEASEVIATTIPAGSRVLEEAGNVINIPVPIPNSGQQLPYYEFEAYDFYGLDMSIEMTNVQALLEQADTVIIPSRRIFANHTCIIPENSASIPQKLSLRNCEKIMNTYPFIHQYYTQLNGAFIQSARIASYPRIAIFGKVLIEFPDEGAEETWTVFDHPVVRIYKRATPLSQRD